MAQNARPAKKAAQKPAKKPAPAVDASYDGRVAFRTDHSGNPLAIRPGEFLASGPAAAVEDAIAAIRAEILATKGDEVGERPDPCVEALDDVRGTWRRYRLLADADQRAANEKRFKLTGRPRPSPRAEADTDHEIDIIRVVRRLRECGISAQPNHVYFANSLRSAASQFNPNMFAPNMFAPNMFAPNMFAPNMFAPNMFAPNMFAGGGAGGAGCCCPPGPIGSDAADVPRHAARPFPTKDHLSAAAKKRLEPAVVAEFERVVAREAEQKKRWDANPPTPMPAAEQKVEIHVIDIATAGSAARANKTGELKQADFLKNDAVDENGDGWADPAMGHGEFVHGLVQRHSEMTATLWSAADPLGDIDDAWLVKALADVAKAVPNAAQSKVLNLSLSGYNEDDRPSKVLADQIKEMVDANWLIVAAAGNGASCRLAWPAALPDVVAVGATSQCLPAWFSNFGPWVDVSAPGVDVISTFPILATRNEKFADLAVPRGSGLRKPITLQDMNTGLARWSGTSFSAPLVAARLAARMQSAQIADPKDAIEDALDHVIRNSELDWLPNYGRLLSHDVT